jgi:putative (di)nucleoside polyphosphate hydrolase
VTPIGRTVDWLAYRFPPEHAGAKVARGWIGQKQLWFAFRFLGDDGEVDLEAHGEIEFEAWRWAEIDEVLETVVAFKRPVYRQVIDSFRPLTRSNGGGD